MSYQKPRSREIEQQLAQLHWRKQQNERSIKNYLEASKVMKQKDTILNLTIDKFDEDEQFLKSIKDDEAKRPLVLNDLEVLQIESSELALKRRFSKYTQQQIDNIDKITQSLARREVYSYEGDQIRSEQLKKLNYLKQRVYGDLEQIERKKPIISSSHPLIKYKADDLQ